MDYEHAKEIGDYWSQNVFRFLDYKLNPPIGSPIEFLNAVEQSSSGANRYITYNCPYFFETAKFMERHSKNCYFYINPRAQEEGLIRPYYWFPERSLMIDAKPYVWVESKLIQSHVTFVAYGKSYGELRKFEGENSDILKLKEVEAKLGFLA